MRSQKLLLLGALVGFVAVSTARADVKPHPLFVDNAVLQQGGEIPVWGLADAGEKVTVTLAGLENKESPPSIAATADKDGKWMVKLPKQAAGIDYTLTIKGNNTVELKNIAVGEVWICSGQSNMEMAVNSCYDADKARAASANPRVRLFTVIKRTATEPIADQNDLKHFTKWTVAGPDTIGGFSAVAYFFGANLQKNLPGNVPIGLIHTSWGGTPAEAWTSNEALVATPSLSYYAENAKKAAGGKLPVGPNVPSSLYNAMIHPLLPFAIKGAIWYQGESNAGKAFEYRTLFTTMIEDWRKKWASDFPFLLVQLAPWHAGDADGVSWAELREAQLLSTTKLKNVGMAVTTDVGDLYDIHPRDKATVGNRLAINARGMVYGQKVTPSGPVYKDMKTEGDKVVLAFDNVGGGLMSRYQTLNGFEICGEDRIFYPAKAKIEGTTVAVSSEKVAKPVAVRFGWKNYPVCNLYNKDGLPATPFRTDDFPLTTGGPKK